MKTYNRGLNFKALKHGKAKTKTYRAWINMKRRCLNKNEIAYQNHGSRGIKVCEEWKFSFENFYRDMGESPKGRSLDRIDNDGNYCKENCRWATAKEQASNRRVNFRFNGETATEASLRIGKDKQLVCQRLKRGWSKEDAFTKPLQRIRNSRKTFYNIN